MKPRLYLLRVQHADGRCLTWMHMGACPADAIAWAHRRWPDACGIACERLRPRRALAALPRRLPAGATTRATAPFVGGRRIKGGVPVYAAPIYPSATTTATP